MLSADRYPASEDGNHVRFLSIGCRSSLNFRKTQETCKPQLFRLEFQPALLPGSKYRSQLMWLVDQHIRRRILQGVRGQAISHANAIDLGITGSEHINV